MKLKITAVILALASSSYGALITLSSFAESYNGQDDYGILLANGTPVAPSAGLAQVIVFSTFTDVQVAALAGAADYATLFAPSAFVSLASDNFTGINTAYGATAGFVSAGVSGLATGSTVVNRTMYAYITSGTNLGLFKTNSTLVADGAPPALESTYNLKFSDGTGIIGGYGPDYVVPTYVGGGSETVNSFQLVDAVPEPSAALLGALGALGLLRRRRI
jgi:hypothetical protein